MRTRGLLGVVTALTIAAPPACGGAEPPPRDCMVDGRTYAEGARWSPDSCNTCSCERGQAQCTLIGCPPVDGGVPASCAPAGACTTGTPCGDACCAAGERCFGRLCVCGEAGLLCGDEDTCAAAGPTGPETCGFTCCGATGPCPL